MCVIFFLCVVYGKNHANERKKICNISKKTKQNKEKKEEEKRVTLEMKMLEIGQGKKIEND